MAYINKSEKWRSEFETAGFYFDEIDFIDVPSDAIDVMGSALRELQFKGVGDLIRHVSVELDARSHESRDHVMSELVASYGTGAKDVAPGWVGLSDGDTVYMAVEDADGNRIISKGEVMNSDTSVIRCIAYDKRLSHYEYHVFEWCFRGIHWWLVGDPNLEDLVNAQERRDDTGARAEGAGSSVAVGQKVLAKIQLDDGSTRVHDTVVTSVTGESFVAIILDLPGYSRSFAISGHGDSWIHKDEADESWFIR